MSLATAERLETPGYQDQDEIRLEQIGGMVCRVDAERSVVVIDYELFYKSIGAELRRITVDEDTVDRSFDLAAVAWLRNYFGREQSDRDLPSTLVLEHHEAPVTPWLGGFHCLRDRFIEMAGNSAGLYDISEAPELRFEKPDQTPLEPIYPEDSQQWWRQNGPLVV